MDGSPDRLRASEKAARMGGPGAAAYGSALLAAALFGAAFPVAKRFLQGIDPLALAGLLYAASGIGLGAVRMLLASCGRGERSEAPIRRDDWGWLAAAILAGGVVAPVLALAGLYRTPAHIAALLLSTEALFTVLLAIVFFGDFLVRKEVYGVGVILLGTGLIAAGGGEAQGALRWEGPVLLLFATLGWGLDNNFTQRLSGRDPLAIAGLKGLVAGVVNLGLSAAAGIAIPLDARTLGLSAILGFLSYGVSLALFVGALRRLGSARTASLFATAPVFGVGLAWALLDEIPTPLVAAGGLLILPGTALLIRAGHSHRHAHQALEHEHRHEPDAHHRHEHSGELGPHSHRHDHEAMEHDHPHVADHHHRHAHD